MWEMNFIFYRDEERDDFWHIRIEYPGKDQVVMQMPLQVVRKKCHSVLRHRDAISNAIFIPDVQGGSIMKGWMKKENEMITCCSDGTRPVIFKIERIDYEEKE